ncbi:hypothetical protein [Prauserella cavernicola]|uniref:Uncharacterized protein n=1 Tax=Prauserella cavernicola TaxID=2800127 RepID=A0A934QMD1_9PSEU|nr:hypothetical protein [Prauserella cavernicola]MBK1782900.1 hypothetical protein [Prauserella cavernicola]
MPARPAATTVWAVLCSLGLALAVAGTFLPWFRSGSVERSSYQALGLVEHLKLLDNAVITAVLTGWIAVPLLSATAAGLVALGAARTGAALAALVSLVVGTVALLATVQAGEPERVIGVTTTGPLLTTTGMAIALAGALGVAFTARRTRTGTPPRTPHQLSAQQEREGVRP